jgi:hypothetical protein
LTAGELEQKRLTQLGTTREIEWKNKLDVEEKKLNNLGLQTKEYSARLQEKEDQLRNKANVASDLEARLKETYAALEKSQQAFREANEHGINLQRDLTSLKK